MALQYLNAGDILTCFKILLKYYDKYYLKCIEQKKERMLVTKNIALGNTDEVRNAEALQEIVGREVVTSK